MRFRDFDAENGTLFAQVGERGPVTLSLLTWHDTPEFDALREANHDWIAPWRSQSPAVTGGKATELAVRYYGEAAGVVTLSNIEEDRKTKKAVLGYWVSETLSNRGVMTDAVGMAIEYAHDKLGVTWLEARVLPDNEASARLLVKLGLRFLARVEYGKDKTVHALYVSER